MRPALLRRAVAEFVGTLFLLATIVGSGVMAEKLAAGNVALALLANTIATGAVLVALILAFGPISEGHLNPVATLVNVFMTCFFGETELTSGSSVAYADQRLLPVHGKIGPFEQLFQGLGRGELREAKRCVEPQPGRPGGGLYRVAAADPGAEPFHTLHRLRQVTVEHYDKLIAAPAADDIHGAAGGAQLGAKLSQQFIADQVSVFVIHFFEVIQVEDGDAERRGCRDSLLDLCFDPHAAAHSGEGVD
jgi:hypothetical protein